MSWRLYTIPNGNSNRYCHSYCEADGHAETYTGAENCANCEASPYSNTAAVIITDEEEAHCKISLNCLDSFDALRVKDVYAPKRKQGEREL